MDIILLNSPYVIYNILIATTFKLWEEDITKNWTLAHIILFLD